MEVVLTPSMYEDGCELRPGSREYRAADRAYKATLKALGGTKTKAGRAFVDEQARLWRETKRNHRRSHR